MTTAILNFSKALRLVAGWKPDNAPSLSTTYEIPTNFRSKRTRVRVPSGKSRKALANKEQSPLKGWEYPAGSDIRIREVINRNEGKDFGVSYRVSIPAKLAGTRQLKQFAKSDEAEKWAQEQYDGFMSNGQAHFELTVSERDDAIKALALLKECGLSLIEAASFARQHFKPTEESVTVSEGIKMMLDEKKAENLRPRSISDLKNRLKPFQDSFGDIPVHLIKTPELQRWLDELKGLSKDSVNGLSARSKKNYKVSVRTFFSFTIKKGYRVKGDNPAEALTVPKIDWQAPSILTVQETKALIQKAATYNNGELLAYTALGLFAGIRTNELDQLTWDNIDLEEGIVTIDATIAKKRRLRIVELMPNAVAWLKQCPVKKGNIAVQGFQTKMPELVKLAGFKNWREDKSNAKRHSFGTYHFALHQNAALTSSALGHRANDQVLFDSYRSLARQKDGEAYFNICPKGVKKTAIPQTLTL